MNSRPRRSRVRGLVSRSSPGSSGGIPRRHKPDYWLLILTSLLLVIGVVVVYSISPGLAASQNISQSYFITKQLIDVVLAVAAFSVAAALPTSWWLKSAKPLAIAAAVGCIAVMIMPVDSVYQAHRWIRLGGLSFQIAELIKLALLVWTAGFLSARWREGTLNDYKATLRPLLVLTISIGAVVAKFQSDLGSTGVMVAMVALMAYVAGIPLKKIGIITGLIAILGVLAISTSSYRRDRLATFLNPGSNCQSTGYQACQALISVGSGGVLGLGLGYGVQAYGYLPEASDDSIFAIMAEKFGFIGSVLILAIYAAFITRIKRIVEHTADEFSRLLAVGVLAWLSTQMIINIGAMVGLLPLKGITLPLISQGGTSLVFLAAGLGMVFQISRYTSYVPVNPKISPNDKKSSYDNLNGRGLGRPYSAPAATRPRT